MGGLWFDALWNWFSVVVEGGGTAVWLWFDALWNWFSVWKKQQKTSTCCDLMLFEIGFQWSLTIGTALYVVIWCSLKLVFSRRDKANPLHRLWFDALWNWFSVGKQWTRTPRSCDLMLFEIGFQFVLRRGRDGELWFDALWNWFSVSTRARTTRSSCDLMLFEIGFQLSRPSADASRVVIWCSLKLVFSSIAGKQVNNTVVIWCSLKLVFSIDFPRLPSLALWFDALWNWFSVF